MNKIIYTLLLIAMPLAVSAQTGIGSTTPQSSAVLDLSAIDKALLLPRLDNTSAIATPENGMMIYDKSALCVKIYEFGAWSACISGSAGRVTALDCTGIPHAGTLTEGEAAQNVYSVISYTGGNGGLHNGQTVASTGVTGLIATLSASNFVNGDGTVLYTITGTPSGNGTASFLVTIGGETCTLTRAVEPDAPVLASLDCSNAVVSGTLEENENASGVSFTLHYTGGNTGDYSAQQINSTGVTGLIAALAAGTLANGNGDLLFTITGTAVSSGNADFAVSVGGQNCTVSLPVAQDPASIPAPISIPAEITLSQNKSYTITSIYDTDYLPYSAPSVPASATIQAADNNPDSTIDFPGLLTTTGVTIALSTIATNSGTLPAYTSQAVNIPAALTQDGISRSVILSWESQAFTSATKTINATIKTVGGTLNVKKLDINSGIGSDALGVLLGSITYPYNSSGATTTFNLRAISGIPDRMFAVADNAGSTTSHEFIYVPIMAADGKVWLNNNLGANYANRSKAVFKPDQQAASFDDYNAYGSLFEWGRKPDGHELINYSSATVGTAVSGNTSIQNNLPSDELFILHSTDDWRIDRDDTLWSGASASNNPCPIGFRLPLDAELATLVTEEGMTNLSTAASSSLKLTAIGNRSNLIYDLGSNGAYWSSSLTGFKPLIRYFNNDLTVSSTIDERDFGLAVRCIKD